MAGENQGKGWEPHFAGFSRDAGHGKTAGF